LLDAGFVYLESKSLNAMRLVVVVLAATINKKISKSHFGYSLRLKKNEKK